MCSTCAQTRGWRRELQMWTPSAGWMPWRWTPFCFSATPGFVLWFGTEPEWLSWHLQTNKHRKNGQGVRLDVSPSAGMEPISAIFLEQNHHWAVYNTVFWLWVKGIVYKMMYWVRTGVLVVIELFSMVLSMLTAHQHAKHHQFLFVCFNHLLIPL